MNVIELTRESISWFANFVGDQDIERAFGTTKLETGFPTGAEPMTVLERIQELNPNHTVIITTGAHA